LEHLHYAGTLSKFRLTALALAPREAGRSGCGPGSRGSAGLAGDADARSAPQRRFNRSYCARTRPPGRSPLRLGSHQRSDSGRARRRRRSSGGHKGSDARRPRERALRDVKYLLRNGTPYQAPSGVPRKGDLRRQLERSAGRPGWKSLDSSWGNVKRLWADSSRRLQSRAFLRGLRRWARCRAPSWLPWRQSL
jgi:hypothetical protein